MDKKPKGFGGNGVGKLECGCEFLNGTVVGMCDEHIADMHLIDVAHDELIEELFGELQGATTVADLSVSRGRYTEAMHKVQNKYGLKQGHPKFLEWVFTCIGRSPKIVEEEKGAGQNGKEE